MIIFSERKLAQKLHDGGVTRSQVFIYSIIALVWISYAYVSSLIDFFSEPALIPLRTQIIAFHAVYQSFNCLLIFYAYKINSKGDGRDFLSRFICLALPIGIKTFWIGLLFAAPFIYYQLHHFWDAHPNWMAEFDDSDAGKFKMVKEIWGTSSYIFFGVLLITLSLFWSWRLNLSFRIASGQIAADETV